MSDQFHSDEKALSQMVREAGDPSVTPDKEYEDHLRAAILNRTTATETAAARESEVCEKVERARNKTSGLPSGKGRQLKRIANVAIALLVLLALGLVVRNFTGGGASNLAFADVAKALDSLRSVTYDCTMEVKNPIDGSRVITKMKGYFLAPSQERVESAVTIGDEDAGESVIILNHETKKGLTLATKLKQATHLDFSHTASPTGAANAFELIRQLIRDGDSGISDLVEPLGNKQIDGRLAVGFRIQNNIADQTFWADSQTGQLIRVDIKSEDGTGVMNNFQYDAELDASLFSLQPPAGYAVNTVNITMPTESDLIDDLRMIAKHHDGRFPAAIGTGNKEYQHAIQSEVAAETEKFLQQPEMIELQNKLKAQHGDDHQAYMKALMKEMTPRMQENTLKFSRGTMFYQLQSSNDSHYAGKGVKLGDADRPIFWYRPNGSENYRVIYADLSVKADVPADEVAQFPQTEDEDE